MSRSKKHFPLVRCEKKDLKSANKYLRHNKMMEIPDGAIYRKIAGDNWGIDWSYYWSKKQAEDCYSNSAWAQENYTSKEWDKRYNKIVANK